MNGLAWVEVCGTEDIEEEDVIRFDHEDRTFAVYRTDKGDFYATDGYCTHERFHLSNGLVMGNIIECPKHNGRFGIPTGAARRAPVCVDLRTYPVKIDTGKYGFRSDKKRSEAMNARGMVVIGWRSAIAKPASHSFFGRPERQTEGPAEAVICDRCG